MIIYCKYIFTKFTMTYCKCSSMFSKNNNGFTVYTVRLQWAIVNVQCIIVNLRWMHSKT